MKGWMGGIEKNGKVMFSRNMFYQRHSHSLKLTYSKWWIQVKTGFDEKLRLIGLEGKYPHFLKKTENELKIREINLSKV